MASPKRRYGGKWEGYKKKNYGTEGSTSWNGWEKNEAEGEYGGQQGGRGKERLPSPPSGAAKNSDFDGLSGKNGTGETLHYLEKESGDSGNIFGGENLGNNSHNGDALMRAKSKLPLHGVIVDQGTNKEGGEAMNKYGGNNPHNGVELKMGKSRLNLGEINVDHGANTERREAENNYGANYLHNGEATKLGKMSMNFGEINADHEINKERKGAANIYMGQWDSIKEKMIWGVMDTDKETFVNEMGFLNASPNNPSQVEGVNSCSNIHKSTSRVSTHENEATRIGALHEERARPAHVGEKRSERVDSDDENMPDKLAVHGSDVVGSSGKRARVGAHTSMKPGIIRRWLPRSPAHQNEHFKLELPGAWEPPDSSRSSPFGERKETPSCFSYGD